MLKKITGSIGLLLGILGIILCLVMIIGSWWVNGSITNSVLTLFPPIENALNFGDETAETFNDFIGEKQTQLETAADAKPVATALEDEIKQVSIYLDVASGLVNSAEQTASTVAASDQSGIKGNVVSRSAGRLAETLDDVTESLDSAGTVAQDVRDGRTDKIDALNDQLDTLQRRSADVQTALDQTQNDVASMKQKIPRWINVGTLLMTLLLLWFGVAQYCLLRASWRWLRKPNKQPSEG